MTLSFPLAFPPLSNPSKYGRSGPNSPVSKTGIRASVSGVRIPPSPLQNPRNLPICGQFPLLRGGREVATECRSRRFKTAPGGVRLPHNFPTVGFGNAGAASSFMRFRKIGVEEDGSLSLGSGEQVAVAVERDRDRGVAHERL